MGGLITKLFGGSPHMGTGCMNCKGQGLHRESQLHPPFLAASSPAGWLSFSIGPTGEINFQNSSFWSQKIVLCEVQAQISDPEFWATQGFSQKQKKCWVVWCSLMDYLCKHLFSWLSTLLCSMVFCTGIPAGLKCKGKLALGWHILTQHSWWNRGKTYLAVSAY